MLKTVKQSSAFFVTELSVVPNEVYDQENETG